MNLAALWAEVESDQSWRQDEIRTWQNLISLEASEDIQNQLRRPLVLLLYAHFEGFCKFAFALYVRVVNEEGISCEDANFAIAAATLDDIFRALHDSSHKVPEFKHSLPDDTYLHRFAREREFLEKTAEVGRKPVRISDKVLDMESNLSPTVLRKVLFRLGFEHEAFRHLDGTINRLLNYRNNIAHGSSKGGINAADYEKLREDAFIVMNETKRMVMHFLSAEKYLRHNSS